MSAAQVHASGQALAPGSLEPQPEWFAEPPFTGYQQRYAIRERLHRSHSEWHEVQVLDLESVGRALTLNGTLQTSVQDEFTYHEPLVHIPLFAHPSPRRVLVVGGGDGGALRHVLLHPQVERAVEVEIDAEVVNASRKHLPEIANGAYENPRAELRIQDAVEYLRSVPEPFDAILVDSTDPVGPAAALISDAFLASARNALAPGGLIAMQAGSPLTLPREWAATVLAFRRAFPITRPYLGWVPIYPGVLWSWVAGSVEVDPASVDDITIAARLSRLPERLRIYSPAVHRAAFALPPFLEDVLALGRVPTADDLRAIGHPLPGAAGP